jgi:hypothetical protein
MALARRSVRHLYRSPGRFRQLDERGDPPHSIQGDRGMTLQRNVGTIDRIVRFAIAAALAALIVGGVATGPIVVVAAALAAVMLVTGVMGFCPIYAVFGLSTCPARR